MHALRHYMHTVYGMYIQYGMMPHLQHYRELTAGLYCIHCFNEGTDSIPRNVEF